MAIGDLSDTTDPTHGKTVVRIAGTLDQGSAPADLIANRPIFKFDENEHGGKGKRGGFGQWLSSWLPLRASEETLMNLLSAAPDAQVNCVEDRVEWILTPFPHLVFLCAIRERHVREAIESAVVQKLRQEWGDYVDPLVDFRALVAVGKDVGVQDLRGYFGRGVFVPMRGEPPIGRVDIVMPEMGASDQPRLPDGTPAGLYRGQGSLTMAHSEREAPATSEYLPPGSRFELRGAFGEAEAADFMLEREAAGPDALYVEVEAVTAPEGYDAAFRVEAPDGSHVELRIVEDARASKLWSRRPAARFCFQLIGVMAPFERPDFDVNRWWIDLDRHQYLIRSAMRPRVSTVIAEGGRQSTYNWQASGGDRFRNSPVRLDTLETSDGPSDALVKTGGGFGFLLPPPRNTQVSFQPPAPGTKVKEDLFELDWLDFAGAVETPRLVAERLGAYWSKWEESVALPGLDGASDRRPGFLSRRSRDAVFERAWTGEWRADVEIISGPLLLRIVEGGGAA